METWTILSESGDIDSPIDDPQQRIRPVLAGRGPEIAWLPGDGQVASYQASGFAVKILRDKAFKTLAEVPGEDLTIHVTAQRVVLVMPDVDPGSSMMTDLADVIIGGAAGTLRDMARSVAGCAGMREKYHLVSQIDYLCMGFVRYHKTGIWGARSLLDICAVTGEPARLLEIVATSVARKSDVEGLARDIFERAKSAQKQEDLRPLTPQQRRFVQDASFRRSGDGHQASLGETAMPLTNLAALTGGAAEGSA